MFRKEEKFDFNDIIALIVKLVAFAAFVGAAVYGVMKLVEKFKECTACCPCDCDCDECCCCDEGEETECCCEECGDTDEEKEDKEEKSGEDAE